MKTAISGMIKRPVQRWLSVSAAVVVAVLMLCVSELSYRESAGQLDQLVLKGQVRVQALQMLQRISDAESGKRGYLLVGGAEYMAPYVRAHDEALRTLAEMKRLYAELHDAEGESRRLELVRLVEARFGEMDEVLRLHGSGKSHLALEIVRSGIGRDLMDRVRVAVDALVQHENARIATGLKSVYETLWMSRIGVATMTLISLLVLTLFVRQGRELERQRVQRQAEIVEERDRLEAEVLRRTGDLTELARHLQTAREDERAHLARELHDELGALLTTAKLDAARIRPKLQQTLPDLVPCLSHLTETLNSGIALKRRIIEDLRPSTLSTLGLLPALEILCGEVQERSGLDILTRFEPVSLSSSADLTVYRVVQEALTNIVKYAQARTVQVELHNEPERVCVRVEDDGVGFDLSQTRIGSHGLRGMRFRVESENGRLEIASRAGQGTELTACLPRVAQGQG